MQLEGVIARAVVSFVLRSMSLGAPSHRIFLVANVLHSNLHSQSRGSELPRCTEPQAASDSEGPGSDTPWLLAPSPGACRPGRRPWRGVAWRRAASGQDLDDNSLRAPGLPRTSPVQVMLFNNNRTSRPAGKKGPDAAGEGPSAEGRPVSHPGNL